MQKKTPISLKQGTTWPGMSTLSNQGQIGGASFDLLEGCYINEDGGLLKRFPGFAPVFDINYGALTTSTFAYHHGFKMMPGGRLIVVSEDNASAAGDGATHDSLFVHILEDYGLVGDTAKNADFEFEVANRYGKGSHFAGNPANISFARGQQVLPYKVGLEIVKDRLLINAPGYECIFQVPSMSRIVSENLPQLAYTPRCLGVPKAIINDVDTAEAGGGTLTAGDYYLRVAYKDQYTGEVGLASEALKITIAGATASVDLYLCWPSEHMPESLALTGILFVSKKGSGKEFMGAVKEFTIPANTDSSTRGTVLVAGLTWNEATDIDFTFAPPVIEQMPVGAKTMRTLRGYTFFGGVQGDYGDDGQSILGIATKYTDATLGDVIQTNDEDDSQYGSTTMFKQGFGIGSQSIPTGYAGANLKTFDAWGGGKYSERSDRTVNQKQARLQFLIGNAHENIYHTILHEKLTTMSTGRHLLQLTPERGTVRFSEQDAPNALPAINRIFMDSDFGEDIEGIGKTGNTLIVCTRNQTYGLAFAETPRGRAPIQLSTRFGCIAPNSMVEFDGGVMWISDRGPVAAINGAVQWVGMEIKDRFVGPTSIYKRDSRGMMYHSVGVHDPDRALVIIGLNKNSVGNDTDWGAFTLDVSSYKGVAVGAHPDQVEITTSSAHGLRAGDIIYLSGFDSSAGDGAEFFNGFHRIYSAPSSTTFRFYGQSTSVGTSVTGPKVAKNGEMSKYGCDEFLVWSYHTGTWSTVPLPYGLRCVWLDRVQISDGTWRVAFMDQDGKIYALEDDWGDRVQSQVNLNVTMTAFDTLIGTHADLKIGHKFYVTKVGEPDVLFMSGEITNIVGSTITVSPGDIDAFAAYDPNAVYVMFAGEHDVKAVMEHILPAGNDLVPTISREVVVRSDGSGGFLKVKMETERESVSMNPRPMTTLRSNSFEGSVRGHNHRVTVEVLNASQVEIEDIQLMADKA